MQVRRFELDDAQRVSQLITENLTRVLIYDYSAKGIKVLAPNFTPQRIIDQAAEQLTLVGIQDGDVVGTASLKEDRVRSVFVKVDRQKSGIGHALMRAIECQARQRQHTKLYLMASISACGFYEKLDYQIVERVERDIDGTPVPVLHMEKHLLGNR